MKFIELKKVFKNKKTGQLSIVIPKKKLVNINPQDYLWIKVKLKDGKKR
jgi:hypothetical protein